MQGSLPYHLTGKKLTKHEIVLHGTLLLDCIAVKVNLDVSSISRLRGIFLITLDVMSIHCFEALPRRDCSICYDCGFNLFKLYQIGLWIRSVLSKPPQLNSNKQSGTGRKYFEVFFAYRRDIVSSILVSLDMAINLNL